jgi:endonuclease YncB( thermonuclease family)
MLMLIPASKLVLPRWAGRLYGMRRTLNGVLNASGLEPLPGPPTFADAGASPPAVNQLSDDVFATVQAVAEMYRDPSPRDPYQAQYEAAEAAARADKRGMSVLGDQYESSRDYRRRIGLG